MKKIVLTFGSFSGLLLMAMMFVTIPFHKSGALTMVGGEIVGYTTILISMSVIFFGIKSYRDNKLNGTITFVAGLQAGVLMVLIATVMYVIGWEICVRFFYPDFAEAYSASVIEKAVKDGATPEKMAALKAQIQSLGEMYKNPLQRMALTSVEILPIGLVFALAFAGILRKKEILPA